MRGTAFLLSRAGILFFLIAQTAAAGELGRRYEIVEVRGWTVHVSSEFRNTDPLLLARCMWVLSQSLQTVEERVPMLSKLRRVQIWLEYEDTRFPGGAYHPSAKWLREHGRNPAKARAVQFTKELAHEIRQQPMMVLHELAHAYHDQVLSYDNAEINRAYARALESGRYDKVLRNSGNRERAYALTDAHEFFAELSEAYFGENDYFPFNRDDLRRFDPQSYYVIKKAWEGK